MEMKQGCTALAPVLGACRKNPGAELKSFWISVRLYNKIVEGHATPQTDRKMADNNSGVGSTGPKQNSSGAPPSSSHERFSRTENGESNLSTSNRGRGRGSRDHRSGGRRKDHNKGRGVSNGRGARHKTEIGRAEWRYVHN